MKDESVIIGTNIKKRDISSAYIIKQGSRKISIVIFTSSGVESFPYSPELESALLEELKVDKLQEENFNLHDLIEFFKKNKELISFFDENFSRKKTQKSQNHI